MKINNKTELQNIATDHSADSDYQDFKIMQNEAQHDLDRRPAKISALSSNNLDK